MTDSLSSLHSLADPFSINPIVQRIHLNIHTLTSINSLITFVWIPGHIGLPEHDAVNYAATQATFLPQISDFSPISWQMTSKTTIVPVSLQLGATPEKNNLPTKFSIYQEVTRLVEILLQEIQKRRGGPSQIKNRAFSNHPFTPTCPPPAISPVLSTLLPRPNSRSQLEILYMSPLLTPIIIIALLMPILANGLATNVNYVIMVWLQVYTSHGDQVWLGKV